LCSGDVCSLRSDARSRIGSWPSNKASISGASWTTLSPGLALPLPTLMDSRPAMVTTSVSRRLLPNPAAPSTTITQPTPESSWLRCRPMVARSSSRPRTGCLGSRAFAPTLVGATRGSPDEIGTTGATPSSYLRHGLSVPNSTTKKSHDRAMWVGAVCWDHDDIEHGKHDP